MARLAGPPHTSPSARRHVATDSPGALPLFLQNLAVELQLPDLDPSHDDTEQENGDALGTKCRRAIALLFFKDKPSLQKCLESFRRLSSNDKSLSTLRVLLKVQHDQVVKSPSFRSTPPSGRRSALQSFVTDPTSASTSFDTVFSHELATDVPSFESILNYPDHVVSDATDCQHHEASSSPPPSPSPRPKDRPADDYNQSPKRSKLSNGNILNFFKPLTEAEISVAAPAPSSTATANLKRKHDLTTHFAQSKGSLQLASHTFNKRSEESKPSESVTISNPSITEETSHDSNDLKDPREHWQSRELPACGLFANDLPDSYSHTALRVRYECLRYAIHYGITLPPFDEVPKGVIDDHESLLSWLSSLRTNAKTQANYEPIQSTIWQHCDEKEWQNQVGLSGILNFQSTKDKAALGLKLNPPRQHKKSNRFFRKFGSNRFLKIMLPRSKHAPPYLNKKQLEGRIIQWLRASRKRLLGCVWSVVFIKPSKTTSKKRERFGDLEGHEVFLFAEEGPNLQPVRRRELLDWLIPFKLLKNKRMAACKLYSRLELGFSSTIPTIVFKPSQVHEVPNKLSDGLPEDAALNDQLFDWTAVAHPSHPREMNDGCEMISAAAALLIWNKLGGVGPTPSAFQARIGPWKGVWMVASSPHHGKINEDDVWIRVNPTQTKFQRHTEDRHDNTFDPLRLSFDVVQYARKPSTSVFYHEYLPIFEDRGTAREVCQEVVSEWLETERGELEVALSHSLRLLEWLQYKKGTLSTYPEGTEWCGSSRKTQSMMLQTMIQSGYNIRKFEYLAKVATQTIKSYLTGISNDLKIAIRYSTSLIGVADPYSVLKPSEISLVFSDPAIAGSPILSDCDALVSRHPALRRSDIQRVHVVSRPELAHLVDVVVFPTTGSFPLAGKLQGGDYDGDTFWVCWDSRLVQNFRNAPPPAVTPKPEKYNIKVDRTTCGEMFDTGSSFDSRFLEFNFRLQLSESMLGTCTNYHTRLRYTIGRMNDPLLEDLADMHDLLVDSSKNGYTFTELAWTNWKMQNTRFRGIRKPMYDLAHDMPHEDDAHLKAKNPTSQRDIIDHLVFDVARAEASTMLKHLDKFALAGVSTMDAEVSRLKQAVVEQFSDIEEVSQMLNNLQGQLSHQSHFYEPWRQAVSIANKMDNDPFSTEEARAKNWASARQECRKRFRDIAPTHPHHPIARAWLIKPSANAPCMWELVKSSALFHQWHHRPAFVFAMAGEALCRIKADSIRGTESVITPVLQRTKIRKRKLDEVDFEIAEPVGEEVEEDAEQDYVTAVEDWDQVSDPATDVHIQDAERVVEAVAVEGAPQPDWSGSTQYDWPEPPTGTPIDAQTSEKYETAPQDWEATQYSELSEGYSQLELAG
ncbi:MAG: hypothetical protein Q9162_003388 [Coniocarpon cinnabarinum]